MMHAAVAAPPDKTMFEIYRRPYDGDHRAIYYTEIDDHHRDHEIAKALEGETIFNGFIDGSRSQAAKAEIARILKELDAGAALDENALRVRLGAYLVD